VSRIDEYLDGERERLALEPDERADAEVLERAIDHVREVLDARPAPDLSPRVMRAIEGARITPQRHVVARFVLSLWESREVSVRLRPAYALIAVVALAALVASIPFRPIAPRPEAQTGSTATLFVQFRLQAPGASSVRLAGTFTNWQPEYELSQSAPGVWTITLPLPAGVHDYAFIVDGTRWTPDPEAPSVDDGFGGKNSRIALLPPEPSRS